MKILFPPLRAIWKLFRCGILSLNLNQQIQHCSSHLDPKKWVLWEAVLGQCWVTLHGFKLNIKLNIKTYRSNEQFGSLGGERKQLC